MPLDGAVAVLDGAGPDGGWYAERLAAALADRLPHRRRGLPAVLAGAIAAVAGPHRLGRRRLARSPCCAGTSRMWTVWCSGTARWCCSPGRRCCWTSGWTRSRRRNGWRTTTGSPRAAATPAVRASGAGLCDLADRLIDEQAATVVPVLIQDGSEIAVDRPMPWGVLLGIQASFHLPAHADQMRVLR